MAKILYRQTSFVTKEESRIIETRIVEVEKLIGARLPEDYRNYPLLHNGAKPLIEGYENDNVTHDGIAFVANSFTEFIQMIEPEPT